MASFIIRDEQPGDEEAIFILTETAFASAPHSDGSEGRIVNRLRNDGDLAFSFVALEGRTIVGHVAFSPLAIEGFGGNWFGLGPISVKPEKQRQGIGKALIAHGLERLKKHGASGCALLGDPAVYSKSGFTSNGRLTYQGIDTRYLQYVLFSGKEPEGELRYAPAFGTAG